MRRIISVYGLCGVGKTTSLSELSNQLDFKYVYESGSHAQKHWEDLLLSSYTGPNKQAMRQHLSVALILRNAYNMLLHTNSTTIILDGMCNPEIALLSSKVFDKPIIRTFDEGYSAITHRIYIRSDPNISYRRYVERNLKCGASVFWNWENYLKFHNALEVFAKKTNSIVIFNDGTLKQLKEKLRSALVRLLS